MSTLPGPDSWRDAGLVPPEGTQEEAEREPDQYVPDPPRPDNDGGADEADVVEQALDIPAEDDEQENPEGAGGPL